MVKGSHKCLFHVAIQAEKDQYTGDGHTYTHLHTLWKRSISRNQVHAGDNA